MSAHADIAREQGGRPLHNVDVHYAGAKVQQRHYLARRGLIVVLVAVLQCQLTAVATALVLIWFSANSFEIALETVPESTIMESTTMSEDSGSSPRWATSIWPPFFLSSTALMLEEPTSRPTIDFDPNPNMCPPLLCGAGALARDVLLTVARQPSPLPSACA